MSPRCSCSACLYYDPAFSICRRNTPQVLPNYDSRRDRSRHEAMWPRVEGDDWCGQFRPRSESGETREG